MMCVEKILFADNHVTDINIFFEPWVSKWGLLKSYQEKRNGWILLDYTAKV